MFRPKFFLDALTLAPDARLTISDVGKVRNRDVATIRAEMTAAIAVWRAGHAGD